MRPTISVIIPAYKQAAFLGVAIDSVLGQTCPPDEVLVVDDASPDDTAAICARYGNSIQYVRKPSNQGVSAARNTALALASSEFIQFLDADDYLPPDTFELHIDAIRRRPEGGIYYGGAYQMDAENRALTPVQSNSLPPDAFHHLLLGNCFPPHAALVRRTSVMEAGLWDISLSYYEDWDLWLRLAWLGHEYVRSEGVGVGYRQHSASATRNLERMRRGAMAVLSKASRFHVGCRLCARGVVHGRWNIRRHFLACVFNAPVLNQAERASTRTRIATLLAALAHDPLLPTVYCWDGIRALRAGTAGARQKGKAVP